MDSSRSEAAYYASGCRSVADFLLSPICRGVQYAYLCDDVSWNSHSTEGNLSSLQFSLKKLRAQEGGSVAHFLQALPTSIPTCRLLSILGVELASLDELAALCHGLASPLCTLQSLEFNHGFSIRGSHLFTDSAKAQKHLIGDALLNNTSIQQLTISSDLCDADDWVSVLSRNDCPIKDLHVFLVCADTLDHMLGIFMGLAHNTISLTSISITCPCNPHCEINPSGFARPTILDSERQLGITLLTNTSLKSLCIYDLTMPYEAFHMLFMSLNKNPSLIDFSLCAYPYLPGKVIHMLFTSLQDNRHLTSLSLAYNGGEDWPSASSVLNSLRINGTLTQLELYETPFEEFFAEEEVEGTTWDAIFDQLQRNRQTMEQLTELKSLTLSS